MSNLLKNIAILYFICYNKLMKYSHQKNLIEEIHNCYYQSTIAISPTENKKFKVHFHEHYEILILTNGEIDVVMHDATYHLRANELIIIPPNTYHYIIPDKSVYQRIICHFSLNSVQEVKMEKLKQPSHIPFKPLDSLADFVKRFISYYQTFSLDNFELLSNGLITELILLLNHTSPQDSVPNEQKKPIIAQLIQYIDEHIHEQITLNDLANHFFLTPNYISILFKKEMHIPLITYIKEKKLSLINIGIKNGESIMQLAEDYGFSNYSNFFKLYKKTFGYSPSTNKNYKKT